MSKPCSFHKGIFFWNVSLVWIGELSITKTVFFSRSLQKSLIHLITTALLIKPRQIFACNSLRLLKKPRTFKRYWVYLPTESSVLFLAKRMGDRALNKSQIHQNSRDQVSLVRLVAGTLAMRVFFADILLDLVCLWDLCVCVANEMP